MTDNTEIHYTPQAVAKEIKVSVQSVRRWADAYQDLLSDASHPAPGKTRLYTEGDIKKLKQIKDLRDKGLTTDAITIKLSEATKSQSKDTTQIASPDATDTTFTAIQTAPDAPDSTPVSIVALDAINTLQRRFEALESSVTESKRNQRDGVVMFGVGFVAACGLFVLLLLLFMLRNYL
jgi:DNA-binding transcriptional MerR regulator